MNKTGIIFLTFTIVSCNNNSEDSAIIGSWLTDACQQLTDSDNQPVNVWAKSKYTFDSNGNIHSETTSYGDSDCIINSNAIKTESILLAIFSEQGPATTSQGIEANRITITFSSAPPPATTTTGYYNITNSKLCLSSSFHFDAGGFGIGQVDDTEIDFNNCLTKI